MMKLQIKRRHLAADSRGMSLVELVIACAIFVIVSAIMVGLVVSASNTHRNISGEVALQMQSQIVMAQLKEYVIDANNTIYFDDGTQTLTIVNKNAAGVAQAPFVFNYNSAENMIYLNTYKLADYVTSFNVSRTTVTTGAVTTVNSVTIALTFERNGKTYTAEQIVALRNETVQWKD